MSDGTSPPIGSPSTDEQRPRSQEDLVFNTETCRAIRHKVRNFGLASMVVIPILCVALGFVIAMEVLSFSMIISFIVTISLSIVATVVAMIGLMWIGVVPEMELHQELRHFIDDLEAEDLSGVLEADESEPPAVPALAAGRSGFDWMYILCMPLTLFLWVDISYDVSPLLIAGCIGIGVGLFLLGPYHRNTYPVETGHSIDGLGGTNANRGDDE